LGQALPPGATLPFTITAQVLGQPAERYLVAAEGRP
jgi:hypothetical protein